MLRMIDFLPSAALIKHVIVSGIALLLLLSGFELLVQVSDQTLDHIPALRLEKGPTATADYAPRHESPPKPMELRHCLVALRLCGL